MEFLHADFWYFTSAQPAPLWKGCHTVRICQIGFFRSRCLNPRVMLSTQPPFFLPATGAFPPSTMPPHTISWWLLHHVCVCVQPPDLTSSACASVHEGVSLHPLCDSNDDFFGQRR